MAALGYIRISTEEQNQEEISLAAQRAKIEAYCHLNGINLAEIIDDSGKTACNLKHEVIQRVLALEEGARWTPWWSIGWTSYPEVFRTSWTSQIL